MSNVANTTLRPRDFAELLKREGRELTTAEVVELAGVTWHSAWRMLVRELQFGAVVRLGAAPDDRWLAIERPPRREDPVEYTWRHTRRVA